MHTNSEEINRKPLSEELPQQDAAASVILKQEPVHSGPATAANVLDKYLKTCQPLAGYFLQFSGLGNTILKE